MGAGTKGGTATTTSDTQNQSTLPQWASYAQQNLIGQGQDVNSNFAQAPAYGVAGLNGDQQQAFNYARNLADWTYSQPSQANIPQFATSQMNWAQPGAGVMPTTAATTTAQAAQLDPNAIAQMQNPYTQQVLDTTLNNMRDQYNQTNAGIGASAAAAGAYGGSREAVQRSLLDKNYGDQVSQTAAQLEAQGFDKASALAQANVANQQQTNMANAQNANSMSQFNAGQANSIGQYNLGQADAMSQYNAGQANSMGQFNAGQANNMGQFGTTQLNALQNQSFNQKQAALQNLLGIGNQQQQLMQTALNMPNQALQNEAALTPTLNNVGGTTYGTSDTTKPLQDNTLGQILGLGTTIAGLGTGGGTTLGGGLIKSLFS